MRHRSSEDLSDSVSEVSRSGKSFASTYGKGFAMDELIAKARKVAGLERGMVGYAPGYCEENVWHLIETLLEYEQAKDISELSVVYVGNRASKVSLWCQKDARIEDKDSGFLAKDYHVYLVQSPPSQEDNPTEVPPSYAWDLDATLPFPCRLSYHGSNVLRVQVVQRMDEKFSRFYRVISAQQYIKHFASDRAHMQLSDGRWIRDPPAWPAICNEDGEQSTIGKYFNFHEPVPVRDLLREPVDREARYGTLLDEPQYLEHFHVNRPGM